ncbi:hypothetical protein [Phreatobacter sp.]|uniref:hypothetical protein n=1 Tax=Phreatobacter sp. TaxID=1966341 RepID=UPI0022C1737A|nr:hypothetical protein [Phreatobacter sp.]MCZ8315274.1 hypothetical protein [Phreatobacter sp.]
MTLRPDRRLVLRTAALGGLGLMLAGCESLQDIPSMFERRQAPLPGDRRPVFPEGVPGIDRSVQQPANSPGAVPAEPPPAQPPARGR